MEAEGFEIGRTYVISGVRFQRVARDNGYLNLESIDGQTRWRRNSAKKWERLDETGQWIAFEPDLGPGKVLTIWGEVKISRG